MITNTKMLQDPVAAYLQKNDLKFIWDSAKEFGMEAASLKYYKGFREVCLKISHSGI